MIRVLILSIFFQIILFAESGWLSNTKNPEGLIAFLVFILTLWIILIVSIITRLFVNSKTLNKIIYISATIIILVHIIIFINIIMERYTPYPRHYFQENYEYGKYEGNTTLYNTANLNIIDLHLDHKNESSKPSYLDDNNTVYQFIGTRYERIIKVKDFDNIKSFTSLGYNGEVYFFNDKNDFLIYTNGLLSLNKTKAFKEKILEGKFKLMEFNDHKEKKDLKQIIKNSFSSRHLFLLLLDKTNKQLQFYSEPKFLESFSVPFQPKLAIYDRKSDTIYVVYDKKKGIYVLNNIYKYDYLNIQSIISKTINQALLPFWKTTDISKIKILKKDFKKLEEFFVNHLSKNYRFKYEIEIIDKKAIVFINLEDKSPIKLKFILKKNNNDWEIIKIII